MTTQPREFDAGKTQKVVEDLQALLASDGWKFFVAYAEAQRSAALTVMTKSLDSNEVLRSTGVFVGVQELLSWPNNQIQAFKAQLKAFNDRKEKANG